MPKKFRKSHMIIILRKSVLLILLLKINTPALGEVAQLVGCIPGTERLPVRFLLRVLMPELHT